MYVYVYISLFVCSIPMYKHFLQSIVHIWARYMNMYDITCMWIPTTHIYIYIYISLFICSISISNVQTLSCSQYIWARYMNMYSRTRVWIQIMHVYVYINISLFICSISIYNVQTLSCSQYLGKIYEYMRDYGVGADARIVVKAAEVKVYVYKSFRVYTLHDVCMSRILCDVCMSRILCVYATWCMYVTDSVCIPCMMYVCNAF
jgi:hypothetical protein